MKAMGFSKTAPIEENPLEMLELAEPIPEPQEIVVKISTCGICLTDRHQIEGDLPQKYWPTIPGHQIIGRVAKVGQGVTKLKEGDRVGVIWIYSACGHCSFCHQGKEIKTVANVTRKDAQEFLPLAAEIPLITEYQEFRLEEANNALNWLKQRKITGAVVLRID